MNKIQIPRSENIIESENTLTLVKILMGLVIGVVIGFIVPGLGPWISLLIVFGVAMAFVLVKLPEFSILILLVYSSGILPDALNPYVNLGVGHFQISDLILIALLVIVAVRLVLDRKFKFRRTPLDIPVLLFLVAIILGVGTAIVLHRVSFSDTTYDARILFHYGLFFAITNLIRTRVQLDRLLRGIFVIGTVVAALISLQIIVGPSIQITSPGYLRGTDILRSYHPGWVVVFIAMMALISLLAVRKMRLPVLIFNYMLLGVMALGILSSLTRNLVISTTLSIILLLVLLKGPRSSRLIISLVVLGTIAVVVFLVAGLIDPNIALLDYPELLVQRFTHLVTTGIFSPGETLHWRVFEFQYAWQTIKETPILGIGMNTPYRPSFPGQDAPADFIHNGYMMVWLKTGLLGLISFMWFVILFQVRGFRLWFTIRDEYLQAIVLGFSLVFFSMVFSNIVAPLFVEFFNLAFFAAIMGINEVIYHLDSVEKLKEPDLMELEEMPNNNK